MLQLRRTWPFLLAITLAYLVPVALGLVLTVSGESPDRSGLVARTIWSYLALLVYPIATMVAGFFAGLRWGRVWLVPVLAAVLSVPVSLQFLGATTAAVVAALVYLAIYLGFGVVGWFLGFQVHQRRTVASTDTQP